MSDAWRTILIAGGVVCAGLLVAILVWVGRIRRTQRGRHPFDTWD
jgi:hypothetical protein